MNDEYDDLNKRDSDTRVKEWLGENLIELTFALLTTLLFAFCGERLRGFSKRKKYKNVRTLGADKILGGAGKTWRRQNNWRN
jgi:hypothetical protein